MGGAELRAPIWSRFESREQLSFKVGPKLQSLIFQWWWSKRVCVSLQSMAELDDMLCMHSQFQPRAPRAIRFFIPEYGCLPIERLSIKRMQDLGAFPAVLDDLNFKFSQGSMPPDLSSLFMLFHSVHLKGRLQTRLQTNCQSTHLYITSPY